MKELEELRIKLLEKFDEEWEKTKQKTPYIYFDFIGKPISIDCLKEAIREGLKDGSIKFEEIK